MSVRIVNAVLIRCVMIAGLMRRMPDLMMARVLIVGTGIATIPKGVHGDSVLVFECGVAQLFWVDVDVGEVEFGFACHGHLLRDVGQPGKVLEGCGSSGIIIIDIISTRHIRRKRQQLCSDWLTQQQSRNQAQLDEHRGKAFVRPRPIASQFQWWPV